MPLVLLEDLIMGDLGLLPLDILIQGGQGQEGMTARGLRVGAALALMRGSFTLRHHLLFL